MLVPVAGELGCGVRRPGRYGDGREPMETWQLVFLTIVVLLPFALLFDFWPDRDRLTSSGEPLDREWRPPVTPPVDDDEDH